MQPRRNGGNDEQLVGERAVDAGEVLATWHSGWIVVEAPPSVEALLDLGDDVVQGALFE
ncbi:hypothetical protein [Streptomyces sp. NRRL S-241]|uniref:hypothetical protein n=1 Tax=Streptomyces sp. NRRL S-241 TaxID=1463896 RepID=UPI000B007CF2|nr:hypothetical protein [Streptomyces sp. NRRL S-241]